MTRRALLVLTATIGALLTLASIAPAVTLEELSKLATEEGALPPAAVREIKKYVQERVDQLKAAKDGDALAKACKAIADGYEVNTSSRWQVEYAQAASTELLTVMEDKDPVKQVQAAIRIVNMPQYTVQPALEKMAANANAGVRHWAARGYRWAGRALIQQGETFFAKMLATLETLGLHDGSGIVVGDVLIALNPYGGAKPAENERLRKLQDRILLVRCADLRNGDEGMVTGYLRFLTALEAIGPEEQKLVTQMTADVLDAATRAFAIPDLKEETGRALTDLVNVAEAKLMALTATNRAALQPIANDSARPLTQKGAEVRLTFKDYWQKELAKKGIQVREVPAASAPAPKPATAPAPETER